MKHNERMEYLKNPNEKRFPFVFDKFKIEFEIEFRFPLIISATGSDNPAALDEILPSKQRRAIYQVIF